MILGIDEAGRGPWAGPLVVGAVVLGGVIIEGLTDSKKINRVKREKLYEEITQQAMAYASGWVSANEIDEIGLSEALRQATRRAVEKIKVPYSEIIIDGTVNFLLGTDKGAYVQTMAKADLLVPSVSAASIVAKVERDRYMSQIDRTLPGYGFKAHAGYGVAKHRQAIDLLGITPEHRLSFAPLLKYRPQLSAYGKEAATEMTRSLTTKSIGNEAEEKVAVHMEKLGHAIVDRNWRTKACEIDIVTSKDDTVYFVEVKYRKNDKAGDGLAVITPQKVKQMQFAARVYSQAHRLAGVNLRLVAVAVTGMPPEVVSYEEID